MKACEFFLFRYRKKTCINFGLYGSFFIYLEKRVANRCYLWEVYLVFFFRKYLVWCAKVWVYSEKQLFKKLAVFSSIFVANTKTFSDYNFVTPLSGCNGTRTHTHLVRKLTLNHLAKLAFFREKYIAKMFSLKISECFCYVNVFSNYFLWEFSGIRIRCHVSVLPEKSLNRLVLVCFIFTFF